MRYVLLLCCVDGSRTPTLSGCVHVVHRVHGDAARLRSSNLVNITVVYVILRVIAP